MSTGGGGAMPATMTTGSYPDSVDSSPRSRGGDSWTDENYSSSSATPAAKLRFMCSYGGQIVPRPHDKTLCYVGGETRMVVVDRYNTTLADLSEKLSRSLLSGRPFTLKYQLPSEDLDSLISVTTYEDLDNMIDEYDRLLSPSSNDPKTSAGSNSKQNRMRLFLFPSKPDSVASSSSIGSLLDDSKSDTWFVDALNSAIGIRGGDSSVDSLLGLEEERDSSVHAAAAGGGDKAEEQVRVQQPQQPSQQLDASSSFGSQSSGPFPSDLPPIRVRVEEQRLGGRLEKEENMLAQLSIKQEEVAAKDGVSWGVDRSQHHHPSLSPPSSASTVPISTAASTVSGFPTRTENLPTSAPRVFTSDEEKPVHDGIRSPPQQPVDRHQQLVADSSKQDSQNKVSDSSYGIHVSEQGYTMPIHPEQVQQQHLLQQQLQQQQLQNQRQLNQQQQYIHTNPHFAHQQASTMVVPTQSYYQMHQPIQTQPQLAQANAYNQQIPLYVMPVGQNQSYMIPMQQPQPQPQQQQSNLHDTAQLVRQTSAPTMPVLNPVVPSQSLPLPKPELRPPATAAAGVYRTASATSQQPPLPPQVIQMGDQTHQYLGYHSMHHPPSQPAALEGGYRYDSVQPQQPAMYYSQTSPMPLLPQFTPVIPEVRPQLQPSNLNQRTGAS